MNNLKKNIQNKKEKKLKNEGRKMEKNKKLGDRGITLIALVVTIIVLLILAGVSIAVLTGENGILNRAQEAATVTRSAQIEERVKLAFSNLQMKIYSKSSQYNATEHIDEFIQLIQKDLNDNNWTIEKNGNQIVLKNSDDEERIYTFTVQKNDIIYDGELKYITYKVEDIILGKSWLVSNFTPAGNAARALKKEPIHLVKGDSITVEKSSQYMFGVSVLNRNGNTYSLKQNGGWNDITDGLNIAIDDDVYILINFKRTDEQNLVESDLNNLKQLVSYKTINLAKKGLDVEFVAGRAWISQSGKITTSNGSVRGSNKEPIHLFAGDSITVKSNYNYNWGYFLATFSNGEYNITYNSGWNEMALEKTITVDSETYCFINFKTVPERNITSSDVEIIEERVELYSSNPENIGGISKTFGNFWGNFWGTFGDTFQKFKLT